jgi:hypothetical protein
LLEEGPAACLERLPPALDCLAKFLEEGLTAVLALGGGVVPPLKARILQVALASPLVRWALGQQAQQQQQQQQDGGASPLGRGCWPADTDRDTPQPRTPIAAAHEPRHGPAAAYKAGCARLEALLEVLVELAQEGLATQHTQRVAVVAASERSVAALRARLAEAPQLAGAEVTILQAGQAGSKDDHQANGSHEAPEAEAGSRSTSPLACSASDDDLAPAVTAADWLVLASSKDAAASEGGKEEAAATDQEAASEQQAEASSSPPASPLSGAEESEPAAGITPFAVATQQALTAGTAAEPGKAPSAAFGASPGGRLVVHLLTAAELAVLQGRIAAYDALVWCAQCEC